MGQRALRLAEATGSKTRRYISSSDEMAGDTKVEFEPSPFAASRQGVRGTPDPGGQS